MKSEGQRGKKKRDAFGSALKLDKSTDLFGKICAEQKINAFCRNIVLSDNSHTLSSCRPLNARRYTAQRLPLFLICCQTESKRFLVQRAAVSIGFVIIIYIKRRKWFPSAIQHAPHITTLLTARRCFTDKTYISLAEHSIPIFSPGSSTSRCVGTCVRNQADGN
jgi:hypothetical protein